MSAPLALLLDAALRASVLGVAVALLLKLARLRDARAEIPIWTTVLLAALAMPLLRVKLPPGLAVPLPHPVLAHFAPAPLAAPGPIITLLGDGHGMALVPADTASTFGPQWMTDHGAQFLWLLYILAVAFQLARLGTGLFLTARLYRTAMPITAHWARARAIRASAKVTGPISFGRCILLPADYADWPHNKLLAVLAHEENHVARGDFFIQLLANVYRAVFWFSPFAWWLQARLCALAEAASDEAAIQRINDRTIYAEILVEVSRRAHGAPVQVAMAKGPDIHWRIDRILSEKRDRRLGLIARLGAVAAILPAALIVAGAHAAAPPAQSRLPLYLPVPANSPVVLAERKSTPVPMAQPAKTVIAHHVKIVRATETEPDVTYNPRALLDAPPVIAIPVAVPVPDGRGQKNRGPENPVILLGGNIYAPDN